MVLHDISIASHIGWCIFHRVRTMISENSIRCRITLDFCDSEPGIGLNLFEHLQEVFFFMELNLMFEILANLNSFVDDRGTPQLNFIEILNVGKGDVLSAFLLLMATVGQLIIS